MVQKKNLDGMVALATFGSTVASGLAYGIADAKGISAPGREYLWSATALSAFYVGSTGSSDKKMDAKCGGIFVGAAAVFGATVYGLSYGLGYMVEKIT